MYAKSETDFEGKMGKKRKTFLLGAFWESVLSYSKGG